MAINHCRIDKWLAKQLSVNRRQVRLFLAQQRIKVDGSTVTDADTIVHQFSIIVFDDKVLQQNNTIYLMLNKPVGVVCATKDVDHKTVLDLIDFPEKETLHIVGRLDLNTSGLVLLTNDSRWSSTITSPDNKVNKHYHVTLKNPISDDYAPAFLKGMYFDYEGITTQPAQLSKISEYQADVVLTEGRYHQIKRMFGRFRNPVVGLHRYAIGKLTLDQNLPLGGFRPLTTAEVCSFYSGKLGEDQ